MKELAKLVYEHRISEGWSQGELAQIADVGSSTIERIEQAKPPVPTRRTMQRIAKAFGKNYDPKSKRFVNGRPHPFVGDAADDTPKLIRVPIRRLPIYRMLPASHLGGPEDTYTVPQEPDEFNKLPAPSEECAVIQIDGDCMAPDYPSGCYVMVDFARTVGEGLVPGAAYYVQLRGEGDGKATFKRYVGPQGDAEVFDCINKKKFPDPIPIRDLFNAAIAVAKVDWTAGKSKR